MKTKRNWLARIAVWLPIALLLVGGTWLVWPRPIAVDTAIVALGPMDITVEEDAKTRVADLYLVSAPISGKMARSPLRVGDSVVAGETVVAIIEPVAPALLDERTHSEITAALNAAQSAVDLAQHEIKRREAALEFARAEYERASVLAQRNVISSQALDKAKVDIETNEHALAVAKAQLEIRISDRSALAIRLTDPANSANDSSKRAVQVKAPVSGRVLTIAQESEAVVQAGTPLVGIGDPLDLEIVADLLSADAVRVRIGAPVRIVDWGGPEIGGSVERIDPAGFARISALGIEEQRVRIVIRLVDSPETWSRLGHEFSVVARIQVWQSESALTVPVAALFRDGDSWAVFLVRDGRAQKTRIGIGQRNSRTAEILSGIDVGEEVILYPSDRIVDRASVTRRQSQPREN